MKRPDFVLFAGQDWWYHNRSHSDFQLMVQVARERKVVIVNSIGMRMPLPGRSSGFLGRCYRKLKSMLRAAQKPESELPNLTVVSPLFVPIYGSRLARRFNAWLLRVQLKRLMKREGIARPHVMVTLPTAWDVVEPLERASLIYNRSDRHSAFPEADRELIEALEAQLFRNADLVVYTSSALMEEERDRPRGRAVFVDHGIDLEDFRRPESREPDPRLAGVPRPIVGFFGGIDDYVVDVSLFRRVARELPDHSLVLIGSSSVDLDELVARDNVHFLGRVPFAEIPRLGRHFDVAIMPWLQNEWIEACNPIKLKEYLALERRVVTTWFPEIERYRSMVHVAESSDEFVELVRTAAREKGPHECPEREAMLAVSGWGDRARDLARLADEATGSATP